MVLQKDDVLVWCSSSQLSMWSHGVVVETPGLNGGLGIRKVEEPMLVQALVSEAPVEALDERVLYGLPGSMNAKVIPC